MNVNVKHALQFNSILLIILIALLGIIYCYSANSMFQQIFGIIGTIYMMWFIFINHNIIKKKILEE